MTKITSDVRLASSVLYSGHFKVPWHQRYYDWNTEQVRDLLHDLKDALETNKTCYFLGSIMLLRPPGATPQRINDGQQRLITLSLLIAALCRRFALKFPPDQARETLALRALFDRSGQETSRLVDSSRYQPRIEPPRNDKSRYTQLLRGHDIGTNGLLTAAWNVIDDFVEAMSPQAREDFFDFMMQKLEISVLDIPGDVDANSVFEALNARGKSLNDVDLLRNRLYSYFSDTTDIIRRDTVHANLERTTVILRGKLKIPEYFRCYLQCRYGYLQKKRFYRAARIEIDNAAGEHNPSDYVFDLVADLGRRENIELFRTITSAKPSQSLERSLPTISGKRGLSVLLGELHRYKVAHPIVFALLYRFITEPNEGQKKKVGRILARSMKNLTSFIMRTALVASKFEPSRLEAAFANCAKTVLEGTDFESLDVLDELQRHDELGVTGNASFIRRMTAIEIRDNRKALKYLFGINAHHQRGSDVLRQNRCSVEHVLPQSSAHWQGWAGFRDVNPDDWVYRTGNLLVVARGENRGGAEFNESFQAKRRAFGESALWMPRDVAGRYDDWSPEVIEERSHHLAKRAAAIWRFVRTRS